MTLPHMPAVYVAGPYRAPTPQGVELNIKAAQAVGLQACYKGWTPLIPHANFAHFDAIAPQLDDDFWLTATMELLRRCDAVVLCPGYSRSDGTLGEIEEAKRLGLPIYSTVDALPKAAPAGELSDGAR